MDFLLICLGVFAMYWRTLKFNYIIDDAVERDGYLYNVPLTHPTATKDAKGNVIPCIYDRAPSSWYRCFMIGMHCVNTGVVYLLWGHWAALLFAVHPVCVWGTAWVTGNYYATTTYFCLIAYYFLHTFPNIFGATAAMALFACALNSTIEALAFPFVMLALSIFEHALFIPAIALFPPLVLFLFGKRFTTGMKIREGFINEKRIKGFTPKRLILMTKVMGKYLATTFYPDRLGFFGPFGGNIHDNQDCYDKMHAADKEFWCSLALCAVTFTAGMFIHPQGTLWFFGFVALHSQWKIMGQFFAVRYLYIAAPGLCVLVATTLAAYPYVLCALATYYAVRAYVHIFAFRNLNTIYQNDMDTWPEHAQTLNNMAQSFMRDNSEGKTLPNWKLNLMAAHILKAHAMNPKAWEINMNVACFYAIIGQWPMCLKYTDQAIDILTPLADKPCGPLIQLIAQRERIIKMAGESVAKPTNQGSAETSLPEEPPKEGVEHGTRTTEAAGIECR